MITFSLKDLELPWTHLRTPPSLGLFRHQLLCYLLERLFRIIVIVDPPVFGPHLYPVRHAYYHAVTFDAGVIFQVFRNEYPALLVAFDLRRAGESYLFDMQSIVFTIYIERLKKRLSEQTGINYNFVTPHILRHCAISNMLSSGVPLVTISKAVGHANINTTVGYTHLKNSITQEQMELAANF